MVTPLLRQLRRLFPGASLEVLCERGCAQILACNSRVDGMLHLKRGASAREFLGLAAELRRRAYDLVLDAQSLPKTALLARLSGAPRRCGFASHPLKDLCYTRPYRRLNNDYSALDRLKLLDRALDAPPEAAAESMIDFGDLVLEFPVTAEDEEAARRYCDTQFGHRPAAALFGVSRRAYKIWPPERLAELGDRLARRGFLPFLVYGPGEEEACGRIAALMREQVVRDYPMPSFPVLKEIIARCALYAGNDGGPKHLAALSGVPAVAVFGSVHPEHWTAPGDPRQRFVATHSDCRAVPTSGACHEARSLDEIPVEAVWEIIVEWMREGLVPDPAGVAG